METEKFRNLKFLKEDAYKLSLNDENVDLVISRRGPDPENEAFRVLKRGGFFIYITIGEKDSYSLKEIVGRGQHFESNEMVSEQLKINHR